LHCSFFRYCFSSSTHRLTARAGLADEPFLLYPKMGQKQRKGYMTIQKNCARMTRFEHGAVIWENHQIMQAPCCAACTNSIRNEGVIYEIKKF
jgi:hypothetical protein